MLRAVPTARRRRPHRVLALAATCLTAVVVPVVLGSSASGQEPPPPQDESPSSTTTDPPPTTVLLDDGDIGVVPPGADAGDGNEEPEPGSDPSAPPGEGPEVPEELPVVILPDPTPGLNAALAALDVTAAEWKVEHARDVLTVADDHVRDAAVRRASAVRLRREAHRRALHDQSLVHALARNAVVHGNVAGLEPLIGVPSLDHLRDAVLADVTTDHLHERLVRARRALRAAVLDERRATRALQRAQLERDVAEHRHLMARHGLDVALEEARAARRQLGPTILGAAVLDAEDLVSWYRTFYREDPPVAPIEELVDAYLAIAADEGVTGDIAFAQAILETGGFRSQHARGFNFAGIGAFDECAPSCGFRFAGVEEGVRAHIQLLRAYAEADLTTAMLASAPDRRVRPEEVDVRGCCPRWTTLTGVWASDPNYDRKVLGIYRLMVETARARDRDLL